jgi:ankyrin repeat protein
VSAADDKLVGELVLAAHGDLSKVRALIGERPDLVDARWARFNETPLEAASHTGQRAIAELLLVRGARMTVFAAAMLGRDDEFGAFLADDPLIGGTPGVHGISLLYHVALSGRTDLAELLAAQGPLEGLDETVHAAVRTGSVAMVRWLRDRGATATARNFDDKTPLEVAEENGRNDIVALLWDR